MHRRSRLHRIVAGIGALATIAALLAGVPLLLYALAGSPLPGALPAWNDVIDTLGSRGISDNLLIDILALIGWVAWLQVAASIVIEITAWGRGRPAPRMRLAGPAQPALRRLIATAALLLSNPNPAAALSAVPVAAVAMPFDVATPAPAATADVDPSATSASTAQALPTYTVVRYDTLWGLAEAHLGDPLRWPELFALNVGRQQPDGRTLSNPDLIRPGWTLHFPADASGLPAEPTPAPTPPLSTQPSPAETCVPPEPAPPEAAPTTTAPTPTSTSVPLTTTTTSLAPQSPTTTSPAATQSPTNEAPSSPVTTVPWPLIGGGLAAAGLVALLNRLRRVQQRHRPTGRRPRQPRPELEEIERRLRHVADLDAAERLDVALRALAAGLAPLPRAPRVLAVRSNDQHIELLLDEHPPPPPKGFVATDHERGWITDPDLDINDLRALAAGAPAPFPSLVSLGTIDDEHLLIDIETAGLLTVAGSDADGILRSVITQLATATWIDHVDLLVVTSASTADVAGAARVRRVADLETAIAELRAIGRSMEDALAACESESTLEARFSDHHDDGWIPTILVSTEAPSEDQQSSLAEIAGAGLRGVAAVFPSTIAAIWHLDVNASHARLAPLGLDIDISTIEPNVAATLDELLTEATISEDLEDAPIHQDEPASTPPIGPYVDPPFEIEVRVLGPVEIHGVDPIERRRAEELVAYLALHPKGASDDRIKTVLWRDRAPTTPTFNTTVSFARTALGQSSDGEFHLPHYSAAERLYRIGPAVTTDLARLEARIKHSRSCSAELAIETLRSALELVRGMPFEGTRDYEWAYSEHIVAHAEAAISDAANRLAELYLTAGDHAGATWAARQGLKVCPADEGLYQALMKACHLAGDPAGAEAAFQELCDAVDALEPYDCLGEDTLRLRGVSASLSRRQPAR